MKNRQNRNGITRRFSSALLALGIIFSSNMTTAWAEPNDNVDEVNEVDEQPKETPAQETTTTVTETPVTETNVTETPVTETTVTETTEIPEPTPAEAWFNGNESLEEYNRKVDEYNEYAEAYNRSVDEAYEAAVEETNRQNAEIDQHNEAEAERVRAAEEANAKAIQEAEEANAKIDEENAAEEARVNEHNSSEDAKAEASRQAKEQAEKDNEEIAAHNEAVAKYEEEKVQYDADYAQYQKDLAMEERILAAGYASVEAYNQMIERNYNGPAKQSVEKNANANVVTVKDTYTVTEAAEKAGAKVTVHIEHVFEGTDVTYVEDFEIDRNDILNVKSIAALGNSTQPGYASLYYKTDDEHSMGYWVPWIEFGYNANYVNSSWNCGEEYEVSYKDGTIRRGDREEIVAIYNYVWIPQKTYKTYNTPTAPTELVNPGERKDLVEVPELYTPEYEQFVKKDHVTAAIEEIAAANFLEKLRAPEKRAYLALLRHRERIVTPERDSDPDPRPAPSADPTPIYIPIPEFDESLAEPEPVNPVITPAAPVIQPAVTENVYEVIEEELAPAAAPVNNEPAGKPTEVVELADEVLPLVRPVKYWALINLICAAITTLFGLGMLVSFLKKRDNDEDEETETEVIETEESEEEEKKRMKSKLLGLLPAVGSIVLFLLTEDMHNRMRLFDKWTIWMIALALVNIALAYLTRNREEDESDENRTEEANA